jgi:membrane protein required for colicin V production
MEWYDITMIVVLAGTTIFGFIKGMAWQVASLASLVVSYFVALRLSGPLAATGVLGEEAPWNRYVAMLVIYLATSLVIWVAFRAVAGAIDRVRLQEFDRQIGGLFGLAKGILLCVAITFFAITLAPETRDAILRSRSGHYIALLIARADAVMPPEVHEVIDPYLDRLEQELNGQGEAPPAAATESSVPTPRDAASNTRDAAIGAHDNVGPILIIPNADGQTAAGEKSASPATTPAQPAAGAQLRQPLQR